MGRSCRLILALVLVLSCAGTAAAQDHTIRRDGFDLHYRTSGTGKPVVFLSGGPGIDVDYMLAVADVFPASYQRVLLEQRGTGLSRLPALNDQTMTLRLAVEDVEALRGDLKQDRLLLVGHSWGGMLAMAYAAAYPSRVDAVILIGPGGPTLEFARRFDDNITARMRPEDVEAMHYWEKALQRGLDVDKGTLEIVRAITPAYFFDRAKGLAFAATFTDGSIHGDVNRLLFADLTKGYDSRPPLRTLNRPVLIVHGHQDPIGEKTVEEIHALISTSQLQYINKAGHYPWLEQPDEFTTIVTAFLRSLN